MSSPPSAAHPFCLGASDSIMPSIPTGYTGQNSYTDADLLSGKRTGFAMGVVLGALLGAAIMVGMDVHREYKRR